MTWNEKWNPKWKEREEDVWSETEEDIWDVRERLSRGIEVNLIAYPAAYTIPRRVGEYLTYGKFPDSTGESWQVIFWDGERWKYWESDLMRFTFPDIRFWAELPEKMPEKMEEK